MGPVGVKVGDEVLGEEVTGGRGRGASEGACQVTKIQSIENVLR